MKNVKLYPRTNRTGKEKTNWQITEKLDGSNIGFFVLEGELYVVQRNRVYKAKDVDEYGTYPALKEFLENTSLEKDIYEGTVIFGEWIAQGRLKYDVDKFGRFHMFAKGRINPAITEVSNLVYRRELLMYAFNNQEIPCYVNLVPFISESDFKPSVETLDYIYDSYLESLDRECEGFIISDGTRVEKYVRNVGRGVEDFNPNGNKGRKEKA